MSASPERTKARSVVRTYGLLAFLVIASAVPLAARDSRSAAAVIARQGALTRGDTVTRSIAPRTTHCWRIDAPRGQYNVVQVAQRSIDVIVRVLAPDGVERTKVDRTDTLESESASFITDMPGAWTVTVTPFAEDGDSGSYAIAWLVSRNATARDRQSVEADSLSNRGLTLEDDDEPAEAESAHRRALAIYESLFGSDAVELLATLADLGRVIEQQGKLADAEPVYRKALDITKRARGPAHPDVAMAARELARLFIDAARYPESQALYEEALTILTAAFGAQNRDVASVLSDLGRVHARQAHYEVAEATYERALAVYQAIQASDSLQVITLNNLAGLYSAQARYHEATELYVRVNAMRMATYGPDHLQVAIGQHNLAKLLVTSGRLDEAEPLYRRSLTTHLALYGPTHCTVGYLVLGLAELAEVRGDYAEAEQLYRRALDVLESVLPAGHPDVAGALLGLAHVYQRQENSSLSEGTYKKAAQAYERSLGAQHPTFAVALNQLAGLYVERRDYASADSLMQRAQAIAEAALGPAHPDVARTLQLRARSYDDQGKHAAAVSLWSRALGIFEERLGRAHPSVAYDLVGLARAQFEATLIPVDSALRLLDRAIVIYDASPGYTARIGAYVARARLRRTRGDRAAAIRDLEQALRAVDEQRSQIGGDEETRAQFFESYAYVFAQMVSWQLETGDTASAFAFAERGRARVLMDQLAAGKIDLRSSIPRDIRVVLERRETDAQARLAEFQQRITLLRSRSDLGEADRLRRIRDLEDSLSRADADFRQVYADIKNASPLWRDEITSGGRPSSLQDIQRTVVPRAGLMLSYQIGVEQSFVFVVPPAGRGVEAVALEISAAAASTLGVKPGPLTRSLLQTILAGDSSVAPGSGGLFDDLSAASRGTRVAGRNQSRDPEARLHALWQALLPIALWMKVVSATEVVVIPDGPLHYLPFEALVVDTARTANGVTYWLDAGPPIRYGASATALANVVRRPAARAAQGTARPMMLSVSNPVFDPAEVASIRQRAGNVAAGQRPDTAVRSSGLLARDSYARGGGSLARLPGTARETELVRNTFGPRAAASLAVLSELEASESNLRAALEGKRFLHLATHGLVDERRGALFASLAFTPPAGETTDHENDGFWQLHEIYEARLPELELAVLSACQSNIGRNVNGEGVFALSRGFSAAGAQRVVASQWSVDDASTAQLIGEFFRRVLTEDNEGRQVNYSAALRDAKLEVRRQAQWRDPYFWAPFVLTGRQ